MIRRGTPGDRAAGALVGLALGDAIGTTLEFLPRDTYPALENLAGGGPFNRRPGEWTDDTALALALADSLIKCGRIDERDLLRRFTDWWQNGTYSCVGVCDDIGLTTRAALERWVATSDPQPGSAHPQSAGNGSLMRLAPVAIKFWHDRSALRDAAARQSRTTHAAAEAVDACIGFAEILADAIAGKGREEVLASRKLNLAAKVQNVLAGSWHGKSRDAISSSGYVVHTLEAALWCVGRTSAFEDAVLMAANLGEDADTTAAVTGQLAGALYGYRAIPVHLTSRLAWGEYIRQAAASVLAPAPAPNPPSTSCLPTPQRPLRRTHRSPRPESGSTKGAGFDENGP